MLANAYVVADCCAGACSLAAAALLHDGLGSGKHNIAVHAICKPEHPSIAAGAVDPARTQPVQTHKLAMQDEQRGLLRAAQPPKWWHPVNRSGATAAMHLTCLLAVPHVGHGMATGRARPVMCAVLCSGMFRGRSRPACMFPVLACALAGASIQADVDLRHYLTLPEPAG